MELSQIIQLVASVIALVVIVVVFVIILAKYIKKYNSATTESEKEAALNEMVSVAMGYITNAESTYSTLVSAISGTTETSVPTGGLKKDSVMSKLQSYALNNGYEYDETYWSEMVDKLVELTNNVNADTTSTAKTATTATTASTTTATR